MQPEGKSKNNQPAKVEPAQQRSDIEAETDSFGFDAQMVNRPVSSLRPAQILQLHRAVGNQAVTKLLRNGNGRSPFASSLAQSIGPNSVQRRIEPDIPTARNFFQEGLTHFDQGNYDGAAAAFERSLIFNPAGIAPLENMVRIQILLGHFGAARIYLNRLRRQQLPPEVDVAGLETDISQAEQAARSAGAYDPGQGTEDARQWFNQGLELHDSGQYEDAIAMFEHAMEADQPRFATLNNIARCHLALGNVASAEIYASRAAEMPNADQAAIASLRRRIERAHPLYVPDEEQEGE